jgi:protein-S-isoprenylcysteine O-methyltransferase Ste14
MSFIPAFEIGIWNAWIFTIWLVIQNLAFILNKQVYRKAGIPPDFKQSRPSKIINSLSMPLWALAIAYSIFLPFKLGTVWFIAGLIVFLIGLLFSITATINFATTPVNDAVTKGAYRYSRHPLYASLILIYLGVSIASASWIFLLYTIIWAFLLNISVKDEEDFCVKKYDQPYCLYLNRTPRWFGIPKTERGNKNS